MGKRVAGVSSFAFVVGMLLLVGAQPAVAAGGGLGPVKVKPRSVTVKPGGVAKVQAVTRVRRDLKRVRICARGPKSALRLPPRPCTNFGTLRRGEGAVVKFRVRIRPRARAGKTYRLRFRATARGAQSRVGVARIRVKAKAGARTALTVCKHGCRYRTIQSAVDAVGKRNFKPRAARTTIRIKPGRYVEGVRMVGHRYDGLTLRGVGKSPRAVIVEGRNAKDPDGNPANNGIEARNVNRVRILNLWARNFGTNGVFLHSDENGARNCNGYLLKDLAVSFNRSYGLYAFNCVGGRITRSEGWGHGDSAWYIGQTPPQEKPVWTSIDNSIAYENVLGYSGTNSRYVNLHHNEFFNNGVGIVPNTLRSEKYWPTSEGIIEKNQIYWNNFNYFLSASRVRTVSNGLGANPLDPSGESVLNYPTGVGVAVFGGTGWQVRDNDIFGNWMWGAAAFSDPFTTDDQGRLIGISTGNQFTGNRMGKGGADLNGHDFFNDGSGSGNCFSGNSAGSTFAPPSWPQAQVYPDCPATNVGSGTGDGDPQLQIGQLLSHVSATPAWRQQCNWKVTPHQPIAKRIPLNLPLDPARGETGC